MIIHYQNKNEINYMTNDIFSTRDLYLAAALITLKFPLQGTDFSIEGEKIVASGVF